MTYDTFMCRDYRKAWKSETRVRLGDGWQLDLLTRKNDRGELVTSASIGRVERGCVTHRMYADYSRQVFRRTARCTEKSVQLQHNEALALMETIFADVRAHYDERRETVDMTFPSALAA